MLLTQLLSASPLAVPAWAQQQQLQLQKQQQQGELHHQAREQQEYRRLVTQNKDLGNEDRQEVFIVRQEEHHTRHHQVVNTFEVPVVPSDTSNLRNLPIVTNWLEKPPDFQKVAIQLKASSNNFGIENRDRNPSSLGLPPNQEPNFTIHHQKVTKKDYYEKRNVTNLFRKNLKTVSSFSNPSLSFPASSLVKSNPPDHQTPTLQTPTTLSNPNNGTSAKINESSARVKNGSVFVENEAKSSISSISSAKPINLQSESDPRKITTDISPVRQIWNSYGYLVTVVTIGVIVILAFFGVVRCLRATSRASRALAHPIPLLQEDRTPLNAEPAHPVPMLSVQSPGCAGMERLGVPARTLSSSPVARHDNDRNHHHHLNNRIMRVDHRDLLGNSSSSSSTSCLKQQGLEQESSSSSAATGDYNCHQRSIRLGSSDVQQQYPGGVRCPHHVKLPDSEWGNDRDLQARAPYQAEITRSYIKPPPNKTAPNVPDSSTYISSHPSKYSSSNLSIFPNPPQQQQHQASSYLSSTTTSTTTSASLTCIGPYQASASTSKASKQYNPFTRLFKMGGSGSGNGSGGGGSGATSHHSSKPLRPDSPSRHYQNGGKLDKSSSASSSRHKIPTNSIPISLSSVSLASYCSSTTYAEHSGALSTRSATNLADPGSMQLINSSSSVHSSNLCVYVACNSVPSNGSGHHQMAPPTYPKLGCDTDDRRLCCSGSGGVGVNYNNSNMLDNNNSMSEIHNSINNRIIMESNDTLRCDRRNFVEKRIKTEEGAEEAPSLDAAGGPSAQCEMAEPSPNSRYRNQHNASSPHI